MVGAPRLSAEEGEGRFAFFALAVAFGFVFISRGVADTWMVFLLPIEQEFGATRQQTAGVYSTYMLASGLSAPLAGWLLRRFGGRVCYFTGVALIALAMLGGARADGIVALYLCVGILASMGIAAIGIVPASAVIGRWFRRRMSVAMGAAYAGLGTGSLLVVPLAQWWIEWQGWRNTYTALGLTVGMLALLTLLLPWRRLQPALPTIRASHGATGDAEQGLSLREALRRPEFFGLVATFGFTGFSMYVVIVQVVPLLVESGYAPLTAATAFGVSGMLSVGGVILSGWLSDRFGLRPIALLSFGCTFLGILCLLALSYAVSEWLLVAYVAIFGIAQGARGPIIATMSNRLFTGPAAAAIYGVIYAMSNVGAGFGAWLSGYLHDLSGNYQIALIVAAVGILCAALPFLLQPVFRSPTPIRPPSA